MSQYNIYTYKPLPFILKYTNYATGENQQETDVVFAKMKHTSEFQKNFELCKELIEEIRDIRNYPLANFYEFEYDYQNKAGTFRFKKAAYAAFI